MTVYVIADVKVTDDRWVPGYAASVHDIVHKHGGKYLARSGGRTVSKVSAGPAARSDFWSNVSTKGCPRLSLWPWCMPSIPMDLRGCGA
jgi:Domain of unknown function (DUF1330)